MLVTEISTLLKGVVIATHTYPEGEQWASVKFKGETSSRWVPVSTLSENDTTIS